MSTVFKGNKTLFDENGMSIDVKVQSVRGTDKGFAKVWISDFMAKLDLIGNQKLKVAFWLIDHAERDTNYINYSQRQIAEKTGISLFTVTKTMKALQDADFIRKVNKVYMINPDVLCKTYSAYTRRGILTEYITEGEQSKEATPQEKIDNISKVIARLQKQQRQLEKQMKNVEEETAMKYMEMEDLQTGIMMDSFLNGNDIPESAGVRKYTPQRCEEEQHDIE